MYASLLLVAALSTGSPTNLDFSTGKLTGWEGEGFSVVPLGSTFLVSSNHVKGKAILYRTLILPSTAEVLTFSAAVVRPTGVAPDAMLDVVLEAAGREFAPRQVKEADEWLAAPQLLPLENRRLREYRWDLKKFAGRRVRIALVDSDERAGCYLLATGFSIQTRDQDYLRQFARDVLKLQQTHQLAKMMRYDSRHFTAMSNAPALDSEYRLKNCEAMYSAFFDHFRKRGFTVVPPTERLMVALFNTQRGFDAYVGQSLGSAVTGLYHTPTNRLVIYDYATNKAFLDGKRRFEEVAKAGRSDLERHHRSVQLKQRVRDHRDDTNVSTVMHEVAHQLSFNSGMLNRRGDAPLWLVEGLAVYCEATRHGVWQGIGEPNPNRAQSLARQKIARKPFLPLRDLIRSDDWLRRATLVDDAVLGYAQSWALFRLLMEEYPTQLKTYLKSIYFRKTPDHRLTDFLAAFGDLSALDKQYQQYLNEIVRKEAASVK